MDVLLKIENLKMYFPLRTVLIRHKEFVRAVDGVNLEIHQEETLGLVGESGSGKSTIGRCIVRLLDPTEGKIWYRGSDITGLSRKALRPLRKSVSIIFQDPYSALNPRMTVGEIIGDGLKHNSGMSSREVKERVQIVMEKVGLLPEHYSRYPHEFSGGQRQRVGVARSIASHPDLVVADEPTSALDVSIQAQVINLLEQLKEEFQLSYLFISHDLNVVEHVSDRIAVMYLGKIVEFAPKDQLYDNPKHPYTIALLSAIPIPQVNRKRQRIILKGDLPSPINPPSGCRFHTRCPNRFEPCDQIEPQLMEATSGHMVACHLHTGSANLI